jgi:hypothetical protein
VNDGPLDAKTWKPKPEDALDEQELTALLSPEEVCMLDACLQAEQRLRDLHINRLHEPQNAEKVYDKLKGSSPESDKWYPNLRHRRLSAPSCVAHSLIAPVDHSLHCTASCTA